MIRCSRRIQFCAGHRVLGHESKCSNIHGHNYVLIADAVSDDLDSIGRVIDFSVLKEKIGGWIDEHWDHKFIVNEEDLSAYYAVSIIKGSSKPWIAPFNPTAEEMARYLLHVVCPDVLKGTGIKVNRVTLWETENCSAEVTL